MIQAVLFDCGGTLFTEKQSEEQQSAFASAVRTRLADYGVQIPVSAEEFNRILKENMALYKKQSSATRRELPPLDVWSQYFLRGFQVPSDVLAPIAEELCFRSSYQRQTVLYRPGVRECMEALSCAGIRLGIISNTISSSFVHHILREFGIASYMECVVTTSEEGYKKPDPEIFRVALSRMGLEASEMGYVGDTVSRDVLGSRAAGLGLCIQIRNPAAAKRDAAFQGPDAPKPDFIIDALTEIPAIIQAVNNC